MILIKGGRVIDPEEKKEWKGYYLLYFIAETILLIY